MHPRRRATISCRCFARIASLGLVVAGALTRFSVPVTTQGFPDTVRWSVSTGQPPAGAPVLADSMIVVPLQGGVIAGHHLRDGRLEWTTELAVEKPLASDNGRVYVVAGEAIHALDATTGAIQWRVEPGAAPTAAPLAHTGWLIVAAAGELLAIRGSDGEVIWRRHVGAVEFRPAIDGDLLIASVIDGYVLAMDVQTGDERWKADLGSAPTEPVVIGGRVYVGTQDKRFYSLHASSGRQDYNYFVGALMLGRATVDERHVYFAALDNVLWTLDRGDGAKEWTQPLTYRPLSGPVVLGAHVLVPGQVESIPAFDTKTGKPAGAIRFPAGLVRLPLFGQRQAAPPFAIGITGNLQNKWVLSLFEPSPVPPMSVVPLKELPGEVVPLPSVPDPTKG